MEMQLLDETITYVRKELTRIHLDLTWADGVQAESLQTRQSRLMAELNRLEAMQTTTGQARQRQMVLSE